MNPQQQTLSDPEHPIHGCPFYGKCAFVTHRAIVDSYGNQCALITERYAPCRMETAGGTPSLAACELNNTGRHREVELYEYHPPQHP